MPLTNHQLLTLLLDQALLDPQAVIDGRVRFVQEGRRNRNIRVEVDQTDGSRTGLFVKEIQSSDPTRGTALLTEARALWLVATHPALAPIAGHLPRFRKYDPARNLLITDLVTGARNIAIAQYKDGGYNTGIAAAIGRTLGSIHALTSTLTAMPAELAGQPLPWPLQFFDRYPPQSRVSTNPAMQYIFSTLDGYATFRTLLNAAVQRWKPGGLIQGDFKWDNCLLVPDGAGRQRMVLVDWEFADLGDPAWDVGSMLQQYISSAVHTTSFRGQMPTDQFLDQVGATLEQSGPGAMAFWSAYVAASGIDATEASDRLIRAGLFAGARLIQNAIEHGTFAQSMTAAYPALMQLSHNLLESPDRILRIFMRTEVPA